MNKLLFFLLICFAATSCVTTSKTTSTAQEVITKIVKDTVYVAEKRKKPKNIILMIGDGMGLTQISAGMYMNNNQLALEKFPVIGLHKCHADNDLITDSAAAATSFASGIKTYNGAIGVDRNKKPVVTILELAEEKGLATGLVATSTIVHATPASFIAHQPQRKMYEEIAADFLTTEVDLFIGGGKKYFDRRVDSRNLLDEFTAKGYQINTFLGKSLEELEMPTANFGYLTADSDPIPVARGRDYLPYASTFSCKFLDKRSPKGFFLMIEGSQIDWGGHANDSDYIITEMLDFNESIENVLEYAKKDGNTLVVITADHETGGYAIQKGSKMGEIKGAFTSDYHTGDLIPVFAYGPGAEAFAGIYENTAIFDKIKEAFGF